MNTYIFKVEIDRGAKGEFTRLVRKSGADYEEASEAVFADLNREFGNEVAFFKIVEFQRV